MLIGEEHNNKSWRLLRARGLPSTLRGLTGHHKNSLKWKMFTDEGHEAGNHLMKVKAGAPGTQWGAGTEGHVVDRHG